MLRPLASLRPASAGWRRALVVLVAACGACGGDAASTARPDGGRSAASALRRAAPALGARGPAAASEEWSLASATTPGEPAGDTPVAPGVDPSTGPVDPTDVLGPSEFTLSRAFAEVVAELEAGGSPDEIARERARYADLQSVSSEEHEALWPRDVAPRGRTARRVLTELVEPTGATIDEDVFAARFDQRCGVALGEVSVLEGIEAVCAELGLFPVYPETWAVTGDEAPAIRFREGPRPFPVAFAGPFMVEIESLAENVPHSTGSLGLCVRALGLSPRVVAANADLESAVRVYAVRSFDGEDLVAGGAPRPGPPPTCVRGLFESRLTVPLAGLLRHVDGIAAVDGEVRIVVPERVVQLGFPPGGLEPGADVRARGWSATLAEVGERTVVELRGRLGGRVGTGVRFAPDGRAGAPLGILSQGAVATQGGALVTALVTAAEPSALALKVFEGDEVVVPFRLEAIPLARAAEQPAHLDPLLVIGDEPLDVRFLGIGRARSGRSRVHLRVVNRANKVALSAEATVECLDWTGEVLTRDRTTLRGPIDFEGYAPLAEPGARAVAEWRGDAPPTTDTVLVRVERVSFVDGTSWSREDAGDAATRR